MSLALWLIRTLLQLQADSTYVTILTDLMEPLFRIYQNHSLVAKESFSMHRYRYYFRIVLIALSVISLYVLFTQPPTLAPSPFQWSSGYPEHYQNYYALLSEGFLSGQLSMSEKPDPKLLALPDPYDPIENYNLVLHDAVLYNDKYYLYFGPLPAITFYIPIKLLTDHYPTSTLCVLFYLSLGFIVYFSLLLKIREHYFKNISENNVLFSALLMGCATTAPFLLTRGLFYEAAISSAFCAMSFALLFLFRAIQNQFSKISDIALFSLFLGLSVAGRPNFAIVCIIIIPSLFFMIMKNKTQLKLSNRVLSLFIPVGVIGLSLCLYNYFRFGSIFEFGVKYQLAGVEISKLPKMWDISLTLFFKNIYYYFFQNFTFTHQYRLFKNIPHILLKNSWLQPEQSYYYEPVGGMLRTSPIILFLIAFPAAFLLFYKKNHLNEKYHYFFKYILLLASIVITIVFFFMLANCITPTERYEMDMTPYLVLLSIITFWLISSTIKHPILLKTIQYAYIILGILSLIIGFDIGVTGYGF